MAIFYVIVDEGEDLDHPVLPARLDLDPGLCNPRWIRGNNMQLPQVLIFIVILMLIWVDFDLFAFTFFIMIIYI